MTLAPEAPILPSLLGDNNSLYRMRPTNFAASFAMQAAVICAIIFAAMYAPVSKPTIPRFLDRISPITSPYIPDSGGGSGGAHDKLIASRGVPPPMNLNEQFTPPEVVLTNPNPQQPMPVSILATTTVKPQLGALGDPLSRATAPSNGKGGPAGIGDKCCDGDGKGFGPGAGDNQGTLYRPGRNGVTQPRVLYDPDPEYSNEARATKFQGSVILALIVGPDGKPHDMRVQQSAGMGLDEKAMEAVNQWKFQPATLDGRPVAVRISVDVSFRLF
jgi:TonB family protein